MEFLMTYGWAILVVLIVIGVMMYSGFVDVSGLLPEKCTFPISVNCLDSSVKKDSIQLHLQNAAGKVMVVRNIKVTSEALAGPSDSDHGVCELNPSQRDHLMKKSSKQVFSVNVRSTAGFSGPDSGSFNGVDLFPDGILLVRAQTLSTLFDRFVASNDTVNSAYRESLEAKRTYDDIVSASSEINKVARAFDQPGVSVSKEEVAKEIDDYATRHRYYVTIGRGSVDLFYGNASEASDLHDVSRKVNDTAEYIIEAARESALIAFNAAETVATRANDAYTRANTTVANAAKNKANSFADADERHFALLVAGNATGQTPLEVSTNANKTAYGSSLRAAAVARAGASSSSDSQTEVLRAALEVFGYYKENYHYYTSRLLEYDRDYEMRGAISDAVTDHENTLGHKAAEFVQSASSKVSKPTTFRMANDARDGASVIKTAVDHLIDEGNGVDAAVAAVDPDGTYSGITPSLEDVVSHYNTALAGNSPATVKNAVHAAADDVADTANRLSAKKLSWFLEEQLDVKFRYKTITDGAVGHGSTDHPAAYALRDRVMACVSYLDDSRSGHCTDDPDFEDFDDNTKIDEAFRFIESRTNELIEEFSGEGAQELTDAYLSAASETAVAASKKLVEVNRRYYSNEIQQLRNAISAAYPSKRDFVAYLTMRSIKDEVSAKSPHQPGQVGEVDVNDLMVVAEREGKEYVDNFVTVIVNDVARFAAGQVAKHGDAPETVVTKNHVIAEINDHVDFLGQAAARELIDAVNNHDGVTSLKSELELLFSGVEFNADLARSRAAGRLNTARFQLDVDKKKYCDLCDVDDSCNHAACSADSVTCGLEGQSCCDGDTCTDGFECLNNVCEAIEPACIAEDAFGCTAASDCCIPGNECVGSQCVQPVGCSDEGVSGCLTDDGCCGDLVCSDGGVCIDAQVDVDDVDAHHQTFTIGAIADETKQLSVTDPDIPVSNVEFNAKKILSNVDLTVTSWTDRSDVPEDKLPQDAGNPSVTVFRYVTIDSAAVVTNEDFSSVQIEFRVEKASFPEGVSHDDITLFQYDEDESLWKPLNTRYLREDLDSHYYEAEGTDDLLGVFAISLSQYISCVHREGVKGKNRYGIELVYSWQNSPSITHRITGELLANAP